MSIFWKVNGCSLSIDEIQHVYKAEEFNFYKHKTNEKWNCYLSGDLSSSEGSILTAVFMTKINYDESESLQLKARVDHNMTI